MSLENCVAVIRAQANDDDTRRIASELRSAFSDRIYIISESYSDTALQVRLESERHLVVGGAFLRENGLPYFNRVGWQCGDFIYYAALKFLPDFDYLFLVESDVSLRLDVQGKFNAISNEPVDFLVPHFGRRGSSWLWTESISDFVPQGEVFGGLFPVSWISKAAISHLLEQRRAYSMLPKFANLGPIGPDAPLYTAYANDESFCASVLMRDGFKCGDFFSKLQINPDECFSLSFPIDPRELQFLRDVIAHPVCIPPKSVAKCHGALRLDGWHSKLRARRENFSNNVGGAEWSTFSGIPDKVLDRVDFNVDRESVRFFLIQVLREVEVLKEEGLFSPLLMRAWVYDARVGVLEFLLSGASFAIDLVPVFDSHGSLSAIVLEVTIRNQKARELLEKCCPDVINSRAISRLHRVQSVARVSTQVAVIALRFLEKMK